MCVRVCVCVRACARARAWGWGYLWISAAVIRYWHDLVRLCHKFYFCPFQMKTPRTDEEKSCMRYLPITKSAPSIHRARGAVLRGLVYCKVTRQLKSMEAHSGQNYLINVMLCLSNLKVFVVIFMPCAFNITWHIINFMPCDI